MKELMKSVLQKVRRANKLIAIILIACLVLNSTIVFADVDDLGDTTLFEVPSSGGNDSSTEHASPSDADNNDFDKSDNDEEDANTNNEEEPEDNNQLSGEESEDELGEIATPSDVDDNDLDESNNDEEDGNTNNEEEPEYDNQSNGEGSEDELEEIASPSDVEDPDGDNENNENENTDNEEPESDGTENDGNENDRNQNNQQNNENGNTKLFNLNMEFGSNSLLGDNSFLGGTSTREGFTDYTVLTGGTNGVLNSGKYIVESNITYTGSHTDSAEHNVGSANSALKINGEVVIFISKNCTLTCNGGAGTDGWIIERGHNVTTSQAGLGAGAGIEVPSGKSLIIYGEDSTSKVNATGGAGASGSNGHRAYGSGGSYYGSGAGGAGGGGAGAGIGTKGGNGGKGGDGVQASEGDIPGTAGNNGSNGNSNGAMGTVILTGYLTVTANSGVIYPETNVNYGGTAVSGDSSHPGKGGGGAGNNGTLGARIGTGGFGGAGGGSGGSGAKNNSSSVRYSYGGGGGGGAGSCKAQGGSESKDATRGGEANKTSTGGAGGNGYYNGSSSYTVSKGGNGGSISKISTRAGTLKRPANNNVTINGTGNVSSSNIDPTSTTITGNAGANVSDAPKTTLKFNSNYPSGAAGGSGTAPADISKYTWEKVDTNPGANDLVLPGYEYEVTGTNPNWYTEAECINLFTFPYQVTEYSTDKTVNLYLKWEKVAEVKATTPSEIEYGYALGDLKIKAEETFNKYPTTNVITNYEYFKCDDELGTNPVSVHSHDTQDISYEYSVPAWIDANTYYYYAAITYNGDNPTKKFVIKTNVIKVVINKRTNLAPDTTSLGMSSTNATKGNDDGQISGFPTEHSFIEYRHYNHMTGTYGSWTGGTSAGPSTATNLMCGIYELRYKEDSNNKVSATSSIAVKGPAHLVNKTITTSFNEQDTYSFKFSDKSYPKAKYRITNGKTELTQEGITISDDGLLSGEWKLPGTYDFTVEAYNDVDGEQTDSENYTVTVVGVGPAPVIGSDIESIEQIPNKGTTASGTIKATISNAMQYSIDNKVTWVDGEVSSIPNVSNGTTLYVRFKAAGGNPASKCLEYKVDYEMIKTNLADSSIEYGYSLGNFKLNASETKTKSGYTLKKVEYYKCDDIGFTNPIIKETKTSDTSTKTQMLSYSVEEGLTVSAPGPDYYYYGVLRYENSVGTDVFTVVTNVATATINKKSNVPAPLSSLFTITNASKGKDDGKIDGFTTTGSVMEYRYYNHYTESYDPDPTWITATNTLVDNLKAGKYEVRYKEDDNNKESPATELFVYGPAHFIATDSVLTHDEQETYSFAFKEKSYPKAKFKIVNGSLPSGMTFNTTTGVLSGEWENPGTYNYTIRAYNTIKVSGSNVDTFEDIPYTIVVSAVAEDPRAQGDVKDIKVVQPKGNETTGTIIATLSNLMEYSIDGKNTWITCPSPVPPETMSIITGIPNGITVYIRYKEVTTPTYIAPSKCIEIPINFSSFTAKASGNKAEYGYSLGDLKVTTKEENKIGGYTIKEIKYYSVSDTSYTSPILKETKTTNMLSYDVETGLVCTGGTGSDGKYYYYAELTYENSNNDIRTISTNVTAVTVEKKTTTAPSTSLFIIKDCSDGLTDDGVIKGFATTSQFMEYRYYNHNLSPASWTGWAAKTDGNDTISSLKAGKYQVRYKENVDCKVSPETELIVYAKPVFIKKTPKVNGIATGSIATLNVDDFVGENSTNPPSGYQFTSKAYHTAQYKISSGTIPSGITLSSDGKMKGVFDKEGTYTFKVSAYNTYRGATHSDETTFSWTVKELTTEAPTIASLSVPKVTSQSATGEIIFKYNPNYEYSIDGKSNWLACPAPGSDGLSVISNIPQGTTVYIRTKAQATGVNAPSKSYAITIEKYNPPVPPKPDPPYVPSGGGGSGGGGGGGYISNIITDQQKSQFQSQQKLARDKTAAENISPLSGRNKQTEKVISTNTNSLAWVYEPTTNKWKLAIAENNNLAKAGFATQGFYTISDNAKNTASTYYFNENGEMHIGWLTTADLNTYYFEPEMTADHGKMVSGWKIIEKKWYYFDGTGKLLKSTITPDGNIVDANGEWVR